MANKPAPDVDPLHGGRMHLSRSRGALSGFLLVALGVWGVLVPLIGPWFSFGLSPNASWHWTAARFWFEFLPGGVTVVGGVLLLMSSTRITLIFAAWLAAAGGAWFVIGTTLAGVLGLGSVGTPLGTGTSLRAIERLACLEGLGAVILFVAATAWGRLSVRSVRDVQAAQRREVQAEIDQRREDAYQQARLRELEKGEPQAAQQPDAEAGPARAAVPAPDAAPAPSSSAPSSSASTPPSAPSSSPGATALGAEPKSE